MTQAWSRRGRDSRDRRAHGLGGSAVSVVVVVAFVVAALVGEAPARAAVITLVRAGEPAARSCGLAAPAGWQQLAFDDAAWSRGGDPGRCDLLRVRRRFEVSTSDAARLVSLTLTARYQDGLVAWLNGIQVAVRRYDGTGALATEAHGPESERIAITVAPGVLRAGANLLALEVRPFRVGRAPAIDFGLEGADGLRVVRGPYLTRVLDGEAQLVVETDLPTHADVRFAPSGAPVATERFAADPAVATHHLLRLDRLAPGRTYRYRVTVSAAAGPPITVEDTLHTPPAPGHPLRFVVTGDTRSGHDVHQQIVRAVINEDPDFVLMNGDLVATGSDDAEWQRFFDIEAALLRRFPVYNAIGNHDYSRGTDGLKRFQQLFERESPATWWSFDAAGAHFVLLDSQDYKNPAQIAWLRQDLASAQKRKARAIFACTHHGPWSSGMHGDNPQAIADYAPLLEAAHATVFFSGHDHHYERGRVGRLDYIVSGGGGAELRGARCGVPGKRACRPQVSAFINEHHYIVVEVRGDKVRLCPRRPDGTPLEACTTLPARP